MIGTVKWFSEDKGYGFITSVEDGLDRYFSIRNVVGAQLPRNGAQVEFTPVAGKRGPAADAVKITIQAEVSSDKISCPKCAKKIIPRIATYYGDATHSMCPFCGCTVATFPSPLGALISKLFNWLKS